MKPRPQSAVNSRYFNPDKSKTDGFFKDTKVNSCHHIVIKNGVPYAITYKITNSKNRQMNDYKNTLAKSAQLKSVYKKDYEPQPFMHAGMTKKPLMPYNPTSYRNRLPTSDVTMAYKNRSNFDLGNPNLVNRKQWQSTAFDAYKKQPVIPISNPGILSDIAKRVHMKQEKIDY